MFQVQKNDNQESERKELGEASSNKNQTARADRSMILIHEPLARWHLTIKNSLSEKNEVTTRPTASPIKNHRKQRISQQENNSAFWERKHTPQL